MLLVTTLANKKAFQSSLLWKALITLNVPFSGQLQPLLENFDDRVVDNNIHDPTHAKIAKNLVYT